MEKINSISIVGLVLIANKAEDPISFALLSLSCKILSWISTLQDYLYSCFCFLFQSYSHLLIRTWESFCSCRSSKNVDHAVASILKPSNEFDVEGLIKDDIEIVMEKLGISWDSNEYNHEFRHRLSFGEISTLFDEVEPSVEEVKEAFDLFDDNKDGYIDAKDLEKMLTSLGHVQFSESECQRMIMAFSSNEDERIDFRKFVKAIEDSFC